ncbi:MAG: hypothetical protein ABIR71_04620 [Chthoniobacterales bacterium]
MRALPFIALLLFAGASSSSAQVQEKKLIDRILEPDMSLQNNAQDKKFTISGTTKTKEAPTKSFYVAERPREKMFQGTRSFFTKIFGTRKARYGEEKANLQTRGKLATPQLPVTSSAYAAMPPARGNNQTYAVSEFPETRPFLVRGKSQKALSQQDHPLTIDQVRELLNKTK